MQIASSFEAFMKALSWTLLHSLWIGLIAAFLAGLTILATRKTPASQRYNILTSIVFLFIGFTVLVGVNEFISVFNGEIPGSNINTAQATARSTTAIVGSDETNSIFSQAINFFNENARYLLLLWLLVFVFKLMRLIYSIVRLKRLRTENLVTAPAPWLERIEILRNLLNIRKPVQLFESCLVKITVTLGYLRPVVLFPIGALTSLPPAQLDAVLLHELAHIRRNDYLINIVQLVLESVFFFNPCVLWISSLIRKERENCCDDMAIGKLNSRKDFLTALLSFQNMAFGEPRLAQSFMASKTLLVDRARRIVNDHNSTLNKVERKFLVFAFGFLILLFLGARIDRSNTGISSLISRIPGSLMLSGKGQEKKAPQTKEKPAKNTATPAPLHENKTVNPKDTGIVINIVPVITNRTLVKNDNSLISDSLPKTYPRSVFSRADPFIASVIEDLKKENLIKDEGEKFAFILSNERLCVNGVTQPSAIHQKIFSKYIPDPKLEHINIYYTCCN